MNNQRQVQELVLEYFKNTSEEKLIEFAESYCYHMGTSSDDISPMIQKFNSDNGLTEAYNNHVYDITNTDSFFRKSNGSESMMISLVQQGILNAIFNKARNRISEKKKTYDTNRNNFNWLKNHLLDCYDALNRNESYFDGKEEDEKTVTKINKMKFKTV